MDLLPRGGSFLGPGTAVVRLGTEPGAPVDVRRALRTGAVRLEYRPSGRHAFALSRVEYSLRHGPRDATVTS
ncbi:hypothetical protein [Quadrisphaera setariae]|uniref:Uncharacterized protein n=1 Tax=Quadrisphaera setariae TaxID=2593304 RepID=A0A5C8ZD78_9ACTN|nr:hypothetical protein [Quadrisphaera setariae]TXR55098.1 hypothetical protein FMM08_16575 [Quadrisphaera setariae]